MRKVEGRGLCAVRFPKILSQFLGLWGVEVHVVVRTLIQMLNLLSVGRLVVIYSRSFYGGGIKEFHDGLRRVALEQSGGKRGQRRGLRPHPCGVQDEIG